MQSEVVNSAELFRQSAPYINAHRGKTFVLMLSGEAILDDNFANIIHDIALLASLGIKLVLVHGARPQIEQRLNAMEEAHQVPDGLRITTRPILEVVKDAVGSLRLQIEAWLSMGLANSPMHGAQIRVCSGNLVVAKPIGVRDGTDYEFTGTVRKVDVDGITDHLADGSIVLLSPIGYSTTGEVFNLCHAEVACETAQALQADKLIIFTHESGILDAQQKLLRNIDYPSLLALMQSDQQAQQEIRLDIIARALQKGVERCHVISYCQDGAMIQELFSRDGSGSMIAQQYYESLSQACIDDVGGIMALISPLEQQGILVHRSRERLESEISHFRVLKRDGMIVACAALYPYPEQRCAELACLVTHEQYRGQQRAERLLEETIRLTRNSGLQWLFVLTTQTAHWFMQMGFRQCSIDDLPAGKKQWYNFQRNAKVFRLEVM